MKRRRLLALLLLALWPSRLDGSMCPGAVNVPGYGTAQLTNTGHAARLEETSDVALQGDGKVIVPMNGRTYFAKTCTEGQYDPSKYTALNLRGRKMKFTVDLSGAGCGCNVAFYLVSMAQNTNASDCGDYYCDANKVCGVYCSEIDIMEANRHAWHTTLHSSHDSNGLTDGYGGGGRSGSGAWTWSGPRSFTNMEFGPAGECVDTGAPFQVEASFPLGPTGTLDRLEIMLSQPGKPCTVKLKVDKYSGMDELSAALWQGMTPVASYWRSKEMLWLDGLGSDSEGPCSEETQHCSDSARFWGFAVEDLHGSPGPPQVPAPVPALPPAPVPAGPQVSKTPSTGAPAGAAPQGQAPGGDHCAAPGENCRKKRCCQHQGHQCYERDWFWAECQESCSTAEAAWSCKELGSRTPLLAGSVFRSDQAEPWWENGETTGFVPVGYANVPKLDGQGGRSGGEVFRAAPPDGDGPGVESSEGSPSFLTNFGIVVLVCLAPAAFLAWCVLRGPVRARMSGDGDEDGIVQALKRTLRAGRTADGDEEAELDKLNSKGDLESEPGGRSSRGQSSWGPLSTLSWMLGCTSERKDPSERTRPRRPPAYFGS